MKNLNIKWKIVIIHSFSLFMLYAITLPVIYLVISNHLYRGAEALINTQAEQLSLELSEGRSMDDPDCEIDFEETGTYIAVYTKDNQKLSGSLPDKFDETSKPVFGDLYYAGSDGYKWMVLDREYTVGGETAGWFRIVKSLNSLKKGLDFFEKVILFTILAYIAITACLLLFGNLITHALSPVKRMTAAAQQIGEGDLTKRINFTGPRDEVGRLAETFDMMLDSIEDSFLREKRFTSDVSHELRTPVTAIIINAEEALDGDKTTEEYKENLNVILREGRKMNSLISQLLMMARSRGDDSRQETEPIDISRLTQAIVCETIERGEHPSISISCSITAGIVLMFDQTLYMRLLYNLIDNAMKYNIPGGWVSVSLKKDENFALLSVEDGGIGISKEDLPNIWNRFYKADPSSGNSSPGLGLSIVKWIAEQFGGAVSVKSELGKGSLFEARFPIKYK